MKAFFESAGLAGKRVVLGIGVFDGVHLGHRKLLAELTAMAERNDAVPVAMTFDPHPRAVLCPANPPRLLVSMPERCRLLREAGARIVATIRFSPEFAQLPPVEFLDRLLELPAEVRGICVGSNWKFGAHAAGDSELLTEYCRSHALDFVGVPELYCHGEPVSSSAIRRAIAAGKLDLAAELLGRRYTLSGIVEAGYHVAGTELKVPTANLRMSAGVFPPDGVYAVRATPGGSDRAYPAVVNIGFSPTFGWSDGRRIEVHLLGFSGNLYGQELTVEPLRYLRPERTFAGAEELRRQIEQDISAIHALFKED